MSEVNWRLITRRRDHTFQPPVPEMMSRFGAPSACTTCHEDKSPEWSAKTMDAWYGNGDRRRAILAAADVLYRAGAGDTAVLPDVVRLAVDRSRGSLIRASAAEFAGQLIAGASREHLRPHSDAASEGRGEVSASVLGGGMAAPPVKQGGSGGLGEPSAEATRLSPTIVNALIGAAADPEAIVRITAVRSLGLISDARVPPVLASHLTDEARLVRVSAAEALTMMGVVQLSGPAGDALARAQDEWAESLRAFNDVAADHTTLGWLEAARGHRDEAEQHLKTAIALDPTDPRPHVYLGVIAAREGRFDQAVRHFKNAKTIAPAYQNLDRLLQEASRRAAKGG
jgi:HEAT repeat protein